MTRDKPVVAVVIDPSIRYENIGPSFYETVGDRFELRMLENGEPSKAEISGLIADADAIITGWGTPKIPPECIDRAVRLRLVVHAQGSVKGLPYETILKRGIILTNSAGAYARTMCEATIGMMLALGYHMRFAHSRFTPANDGRFDRRELVGIGLDGKAVGIVGLGPIGALMARLLKPFNVTLHGCDPYADRATAAQLEVSLAGGIEALADKCQILTIHCGWTKETTGLVSRSALERLGPRGMLINNARMPIVDEDALYELVKARRIYAALNPIPLRKELWLDPGLQDLPNLLLTHGSSNVSDTWYEQVSRNVGQQLVSFFAGRTVSPSLTAEQIARST